MKKARIVVLSLVAFICFFGIANGEFSDYLGGEFRSSGVYSKFSSAVGIPYYEKYGGDVGIELILKPLGVYASAGFLSHFGELDIENDNRFSEICILNVGWRHFTVIDEIQFSRLDIGVTKWDFPDFFDKKVENDIVKLHAETEDLLWHSSGNVNFVSSLLRAEAITPIQKGIENLSGINVYGGFIYEIKPLDTFSLFQEAGAGYDNGSFGYEPAWSLLYKIFSEFSYKFFTLRAPVLSAEYVNFKDKGDYDYWRDQNLYSYGGEIVFNF
ncbi:hypothetical protein ACFL23_03720 [Patescibacteria group bacterium]